MHALPASQASQLGGALIRAENRQRFSSFRALGGTTKREKRALWLAATGWICCRVALLIQRCLSRPSFPHPVPRLCCSLLLLGMIHESHLSAFRIGVPSPDLSPVWLFHRSCFAVHHPQAITASLSRGMRFVSDVSWPAGHGTSTSAMPEAAVGSGRQR